MGRPSLLKSGAPFFLISPAEVRPFSSSAYSDPQRLRATILGRHLPEIRNWPARRSHQTSTVEPVFCADQLSEMLVLYHMLRDYV